MLGNISRAAFVAHLSRHDRADLAAYEHAEHVTQDGVAAVRRQQQAEHAEHHHSPFSLHTLTHAGGAAAHAVVHSPEAIKNAVVGAYHHPREAGKAVLDALSVDTDDLSEAYSDARHGRIKHFVSQRLKYIAGEMMVNPGMPPMPEGFITSASDTRKVFDDEMRGDFAAARHDTLKAQVHEVVNALSWLPGGKLGKVPKLLEAMSKLGKLERLTAKANKFRRAGKALINEAKGRKVADGMAHVEGPHGLGPDGEPRPELPPGRGHDTDGAHEPEHPHEDKPARDGEPAHGKRPHGEEPHGEEPQGEEPHGEEPHGKQPKGKQPHGKTPHGGSHAHDEPAPGPETTDAPSPTRARGGKPGRRSPHAPEDPARATRIREALHKATDFLVRFANLRPAAEVRREAAKKAEAEVRKAHVPGTRPYREVNAEAKAAGRIAGEKAVSEERDQQADLVEKLSDIAEVADVGLPTDEMTVLPILIRTGRYVFPYLPAIASLARKDPRAALRQFFEGLWHT
ncbi:MAG TPA: hypothetical protein VHW23_34655 [Kofleriaceae bacterium]|nr:hypothetical protein [Kofleriaceae bacterium]